MHLRVRSFAVLAVTVAATSCSTAPAPTTPAPTALVCPASVPTAPTSTTGGRNLVVNGSFKAPKITGRRTVSTLPGWSVSGAVKLAASPSCPAVPAAGQYVTLGYGASISQPVSTVPGRVYQIQFNDSKEGVCNIAGSVLHTYWSSTLVASSITTATGTTPDAGNSAWDSYGTDTATTIAKSATTVIRFVAATEAFSCAFDIGNVSVLIKPGVTPQP